VVTKMARSREAFLFIVVSVIGLVLMAGCSQDDSASEGGASMPEPSQSSRPPHRVSGSASIVFLHHSTGEVIWLGTTSKAAQAFGKSAVKNWINRYNRKNDTHYKIEQMTFPTTSQGYPWANYPYDYYNIWVKNAGDTPYRGEPTLEMLTDKHDVVVWKHCFPVGNILPDTGSPDVDSDEKRLENYKLQYAELKKKMHSFPDTTFIAWTGAALTEASTTPEEAQRANEFFDWVKTEWDEPGDNIFLWDFYALETEGGLYLNLEHAAAPDDPHPTPEFADKVAPLFGRRIVDVVEGKGDSTPLTGRDE